MTYFRIYHNFKLKNEFYFILNVVFTNITFTNITFTNITFTNEYY